MRRRADRSSRSSPCWLGGRAALAATARRSPTPAAERGRVALTATGYLKPAWSDDAYRKAGKLWGERAPDPETEPEAYAAAFNRRYGLAPAPYPNDGLPMGLRRATAPDGTKTGHPDRLHGLPRRLDRRHELRRPGQHASSTCSRCFDELTRADGRRLPPVAVHPEHRRGGRSTPGMFVGRPAQPAQPRPLAADVPAAPGGEPPRVDVPAWWHLGQQDDDVLRRPDRRPLGPLEHAVPARREDRSSEFKDLEPTFRDIQAYLKSLEPPKYPFPIDAAEGRARARSSSRRPAPSATAPTARTATYPERDRRRST